MSVQKWSSVLGFHHYMTKDGKYIRRLTSENKRRAKKKVRKMVRLLKAGKITEKEFQQKYGAWKNHASHGNTVKLMHSMDLYIKQDLRKDMIKCPDIPNERWTYIANNTEKSFGNRKDLLDTMSLYGSALFLAACIREMDITRLVDADYWLRLFKTGS